MSPVRSRSPAPILQSLRDRRFRGYDRRRFQGLAAIRTELVAQAYASLTMCADRLERSTASRAETEGGVDLGFASRTVRRARFTQYEIENDSESVGNADCDERPNQTAHAPPPRILIDITNQHD